MSELALALSTGIQSGASSSYGAWDVMDEQDLKLAQDGLNKVDAELDTVVKGVDRLIDRHNAFSEYAKQGDKKVIASQALEFASDLMTNGMSHDEAKQQIAGLESDSISIDQVGNEAFKTLINAIKRMLTFAAEKVEEAINFAKRVFYRFFGSFENLRKDWQKILELAEKKTDEVIDKDNKKKEYTRAVDFYYIDDKVESFDKLNSYAPKFKELSEMMVKDLARKVVTVEKDDLLDSDGNLRSAADIRKAVKGDAKEQKSPIRMSSSSREGYTMESESLPGRMKYLVGINIAGFDASSTVDDLIASVKSLRTIIGPSDPRQKGKEKATMDFVTASTIYDVANTHIELMDALMELMRGNEMQNANKDLDKASKDLKKWEKDAPGESEDTDKKNAYKKAVNLATSVISAERKRCISFPANFAQYVRSYSNAMLSVARDSLAAHGKP